MTILLQLIAYLLQKNDMRMNVFWRNVQPHLTSDKCGDMQKAYTRKYGNFNPFVTEQSRREHESAYYCITDG